MNCYADETPSTNLSSSTISNSTINNTSERNRQIINDLFIGLHKLPDNATATEMFIAQIKADFAPFLLLIPKPVKQYISREVLNLSKRIYPIIEGPLRPMLKSGGIILNIVGQSIIFVGQLFVKLSVHIMPDEYAIDNPRTSSSISETFNVLDFEAGESVINDSILVDRIDDSNMKSDADNVVLITNIERIGETIDDIAVDISG